MPRLFDRIANTTSADDAMGALLAATPAERKTYGDDLAAVNAAQDALKDAPRRRS